MNISRPYKTYNTGDKVFYNSSDYYWVLNKPDFDWGYMRRNVGGRREKHERIY